MHSVALVLLCGVSTWLGALASAPSPAADPSGAPAARPVAASAAPGAAVMAAPVGAAATMTAPAGAAATMTAPAAAPGAMTGSGGWKPYNYGKAGSKKKGVSSGTLVVIAYGLIWGVLLLYVVVLARRQRSLREELDALKDLMERTADAPADRPDAHREGKEERPT